MNIYIHAPEDFKNLCMITRTLDALGVSTCHVYDPHKLLRPSYGKSNSARIRKISSGAFFRIQFQIVTDPSSFLLSHQGRKVATVINSHAIQIQQFQFMRNDLVVFGSEGNGLPTSIIELCQVQLTIPQVGITGSLNLSLALGIVLYEHQRQLTITSDSNLALAT